MNKEALYIAINEIDVDLIPESDSVVFAPKASIFFKKLLYTSAAAALFLFLTCSAIHFTNTEKLVVSPSGEPFTTVQKTTDTVHTTDFSKSSDTDGLDSHHSPDFSHYTLSMWLSSPDVIWNTNQLKGETISRGCTPLGTIKIADSLKSLIENNGEHSVYAVLVDFSSCVEEKEAENWEYNGNSVKKLRDSFESGNKSKSEISEYKRKIREVRIAYNNMRIKGFEGTFNEYGLKIYTSDSDSFMFSHYFYIFATAEQIQSLRCKNNEAFILSPADRLKIK